VELLSALDVGGGRSSFDFLTVRGSFRRLGHLLWFDDRRKLFDGWLG